VIKYLFLVIGLTSILFGGKFTNKEVSISNLNSTSHEFVYDSSNSDKKLSELIWNIQNAQLIGFKVNYINTKKRYLAFNFKTKINDGTNTMDDYDWLKDGESRWSDWSHHTNTKLKVYYLIDASINAILKPYKDIQKRLFVGYRLNYKEFKAYDGTYLYSKDNGFRNKSGNFSGLGISYNEVFSAFYLGFGANKYYQRFIFDAKIIYSPFVYAENEDTHHFRYFTNYNTFDNTTMLEFNLMAKYLYSKNTNFAISYNIVDYAKADGYTTRTYHEGATEESAGTTLIYDGAGISSRYSMVTFSFIKKF
jgi:outer membrane protease